MERTCIYCGKHISEYAGNDAIDGLHEIPDGAVCCGVCHNITLINRAFKGIVHAHEKELIRKRLKEIRENIDFLMSEEDQLFRYYMPPNCTEGKALWLDSTFRFEFFSLYVNDRELEYKSVEKLFMGTGETDEFFLRPGDTLKIVTNKKRHWYIGGDLLLNRNKRPVLSKGIRTVIPEEITRNSREFYHLSVWDKGLKDEEAEVLFIGRREIYNYFKWVKDESITKTTTN